MTLRRPPPLEYGPASARLPNVDCSADDRGFPFDESLTRRRRLALTQP
jgi:hypothetical protein